MARAIIVAVLAFILSQQAWAGDVQIVPLPPAEGLQDLPAAPWVESAENWWHGREATFAVRGEGDYRAQGWVAVSNEAVLLHIVVHDPVHLNTREPANIWEQDSIQVGLDAYGDGAGAMPRDAVLVGPDDLAMDFALTASGPALSITALGKLNDARGVQVAPMPVVRDEQAGTTTYDLAFPWPLMNARPGVAPALGLAIRFNDVSEEKGPQARLDWGAGMGYNQRPGQFNRLAIGNPPQPVVSVAASGSELWRPGQCGEVLVAVAGVSATVEAQCGQQSAQLRLEPSGDPGIRRYAVRARVDELPAEPLTLQVRVKEGDAIVAETAAELSAPALIVPRLQQRVQELVARSPNELVTRHLRSIEALVLADWARSASVLDVSPQLARTTVAKTQSILARLTDDRADWSGYVSRRQRLVLTFISARDGTLQPYRLTLPQNWERSKKYPMIVYLHGTGDPHPLHLVDRGLEMPYDQDAKRYYETIDDAAAGAYVLEPFARGNSMYMDIGETDVWEAIADAKKTFGVDEDRMYLTGFSMGGYGTWGLGVRAPDRWAAIAVCAGAARVAPVGLGLSANLASTPVMLWHGEGDQVVPVARMHEIRRELEEYGNRPHVRVLPDVGHALFQPERDIVFAWLLTHKRQRPAAFSFVADTPQHTGCWGIVMEPEVPANPLPQFTCHVAGSVVRIDSQSARGLTVTLGEGGLGLTGEVEVYWNGQKAYAGPVKEIKLARPDVARKE